MNRSFFYFPKKRLAILFAAGLALASCTQLNVYEKNSGIPGSKWNHSNVISGSISISDTTKPYNIYIVLRHTDAYRYNNIWLNVGLQPPGDSMHIEKLNFSLGNDRDGWEGRGMDDIWEVRKRINVKPEFFKRRGEYHFSISQEMREDPLPHIISAGLRVEKEKP